MSGVKGRSGRKAQKIQVMDDQVHAMCSDWLFRNFKILPPEKQMEVACKMLYKFGISKTQQDIQIKQYTDQEKQTILEFFSAIRARALNTEGVPHATEQATSN